MRENLRQIIRETTTAKSGPEVAEVQLIAGDRALVPPGGAFFWSDLGTTGATPDGARLRDLAAYPPQL